MKRLVKLAILAVGLALLVAFCIGEALKPTKQQVSQDFEEIFAKEAGPNCRPVITDIGAGDWDIAGGDMYVDFDVVAEAKLAPATGWLAGIELSEGDRLYNGELEMSYVASIDDAEAGWKLVGYDLRYTPTRDP